MKIYKIGYNYFSTIEKAEEYRRRFYRSYPYIEQIVVDKPFPEKIFIGSHWRIKIDENPNSEPTIENVWFSDNIRIQEDEKPSTITISKDYYSGVSVRGLHMVDKVSDIYKLRKSKDLENKIIKGVKCFLELDNKDTDKYVMKI